MRHPSTADVAPSAAYILDPGKLNGLCGSSEEDVDREPASAATAADHLLSSSSSAVHSAGAMLKHSERGELVLDFNLFSPKMTPS